MADPVLGAVVAKAAAEAGSSAADTTGNLIQRMFGPAADEFGQALARSVAYRMRNFGRIADKAARKASADQGRGIVNARVAYTLLDEGSLCDDELMAEYLGGLLAGSRSQDGRDDRGVTWTKVVTGLSVFQVRAHYLLYREWADRLHGVDDLNLGNNREAVRAGMQVDLDEFLPLLLAETDVYPNSILSHAIAGLVNVGLLADAYSFGPKDAVASFVGEVQYDRVLIVSPSIPGLELYGWAQGLPGLMPFEFPSRAAVFDTEPPMPRITSALLPLLAAAEDKSPASS